MHTIGIFTLEDPKVFGSFYFGRKYVADAAVRRGPMTETDLELLQRRYR